MARERWVEAASEILGTAVTDAVPVVRRRANVWLFIFVGTASFVGVVILDFLAIPGMYLPVLSVLPAVMVAQQGLESRFAALAQDDILWMLSATRWFPRPMASIRELDPLQVSGPTGLFGQTHVITGAKHSVGLPHKRALQRMLERARQPAAG